MNRSKIWQKIVYIFLPHKAYPFLSVMIHLLLRQFGQTDAVKGDPACAGALQPSDDIEKRGFPAAGFSDDRQKLAPPDRKVQTLKGHNLQILGLIDLHETITVDQDI